MADPYMGGLTVSGLTLATRADRQLRRPVQCKHYSSIVFAQVVHLHSRA